MFLLVLYSRFSNVSTVRFLLYFPLANAGNAICVFRVYDYTTLIAIALFNTCLRLSGICHTSNFILLMKFLQITTKETVSLSVN